MGAYSSSNCSHTGSNVGTTVGKLNWVVDCTSHTRRLSQRNVGSFQSGGGLAGWRALTNELTNDCMWTRS